MNASVGGTWQPPPIIDEFHLLRPLGQGAMGQVYLGQDTLLDRQVAVKFISALRPDQRARQRFLIEARAVARLQHPNVVTIYRVGEIDDHPFLVSELVRGVSLNDMAKPAPWSQVLELAIEAARGLAAAHRQGVLHRDIKPANMMLAADGQVKLLDFGLATISDGLAASTDAGMAGPGRPAAPVQGNMSLVGDGDGRVGTPLYMAPEVRRGQPATRRSDVYSLGCVLFELCTGMAPLHVALGTVPLLSSSSSGTPITPDTRPVICRDTQTQDESTDECAPDAEIPRPPSVHRLVKDIDRAFAGIIDRCLEIDPALRFTSGEELWDALMGLRAATPAGRVPAGNPYRGLLPFSEEHRTLFFGRDAEVRLVLERLHTEPMVLLAGGSGTGKTSLCRAGVLPLCVEGALGGERRWSVIQATPGPRPIRSLAAVLAPLLLRQEEDLAAQLLAEPRSLAQMLRRQEQGAGVVLFIDQLEELFTLASSEEAGLCGELLGAFDLQGPAVRVLLAIRADFLPRLLSLPGIGAVVARALYLLRPLDTEGVREAVVGPARCRGVRFETEALVNTLVAEAEKTAGGLSLLQFALSELWQARDQGAPVITETSLEELGGVIGALTRHADGVLSQLDEAGRNQARRLFSALVDRDGRRLQRTRAELCPEGESGAVLESLVRGRLVVATQTAGETAYEIAHDALVQQWTTLREWLDRSVEVRAARQRIEVAAAEWERLGRPREALWQERLLQDVTQVHEADLWPREAAFLMASRQAARRRRLIQRAILISLPLLAVLGYGSLRLAAQRALDRAVRSHVTKAMPVQQRAERARQDGLARRAAALDRFDRGEGAEAETVWAEAQALLGQADEAYATASQELEAALILDPHRDATRRLLSDVTVARVLLLEELHRIGQRDELLRRLPTYDESGERQRFLLAPATIDVNSEPQGAPVTLYHAVDGAFRLERTLGRTPLQGEVLPPGSWLLSFGPPQAGGLPAGQEPPAPEVTEDRVRLPLLLSRGERRTLSVPLPGPGQIPPGYAYVPPGDFLYGSADDDALRQWFLHAQPLHSVHTSGYLIGRTEVTFGEWLDFLRALPAAERVRRLPGGGNLAGNLRLEELSDGTYRLHIRPVTREYTAIEGEPIRYGERDRRGAQDWRRMPVSGISWQDAQAYVAWLDQTRRLRGARLCDEREWERAARGADGRRFPHGERLLPDDANFDETYGRNPLGFGPDEVGSHPRSQSPFGLMDMVGNVWELTQALGDHKHTVLRGGGWYYDQVTGWATNREVRDDLSLRDLILGLRVCASLPMPP